MSSVHGMDRSKKKPLKTDSQEQEHPNKAVEQGEDAEVAPIAAKKKKKKKALKRL